MASADFKRSLCRYGRPILVAYLEGQHGIQCYDNESDKVLRDAIISLVDEGDDGDDVMSSLDALVNERSRVLDKLTATEKTLLGLS